MKLGGIVKVQKFIVKNAPTILSVMGAVGTVAAVILSSDSAIKAKRVIAEAEEKAKGENYDTYIRAQKLLGDGKTQEEVMDVIEIHDAKIIEPPLSKADIAMIYLRCYFPTIVMTAASLFCIFGSNHINKQRIASIAGAYILKETAFEEYKQKAEEIIGKKKAREIDDEIVHQHILDNPPTEANTFQTTIPNAVQLSLWFDETSQRYFYSNAEYIRKAELEANRMLDKNGFVGVNDVYGLLGIPEVPMGENLGWDKEVCNEVHIIIGSDLLGPDIPCGTIRMEVHPTSAWLADV